jgi:hypothetical protein
MIAVLIFLAAVAGAAYLVPSLARPFQWLAKWIGAAAFVLAILAVLTTQDWLFSAYMFAVGVGFVALGRYIQGRIDRRLDDIYFGPATAQDQWPQS